MQKLIRLLLGFLLISFSPVQAADANANTMSSETLYDMPLEEFNVVLTKTRKESKKEEAKFKYIDVRNEFSEAVKISINAMDANANLLNQELYLNAYEQVKKFPVSKNVDYEVEVFDLYGQYLGYLRGVDLRSAKRLQVSPFKISYKIIETKPEEALVNGSVAEVKEPEPIVEKPKEKKVEPVVEKLPAPEKLIEEEKKIAKVIDEIESQINGEVRKAYKKIKIANISDFGVHLDISEDGEAIGEGWSISNDIYVPQFLNFKSAPVEISEDATINVKVEDRLITKKASELNVDRQGNYTWFITLEQPVAKEE